MAPASGKKTAALPWRKPAWAPQLKTRITAERITTAWEAGDYVLYTNSPGSPSAKAVLSAYAQPGEGAEHAAWPLTWKCPTNAAGMINRACPDPSGRPLFLHIRLMRSAPREQVGDILHLAKGCVQDKNHYSVKYQQSGAPDQQADLFPRLPRQFLCAPCHKPQKKAKQHYEGRQNQHLEGASPPCHQPRAVIVGRDLVRKEGRAEKQVPWPGAETSAHRTAFYTTSRKPPFHPAGAEQDREKLTVSFSSGWTVL